MIRFWVKEAVKLIGRSKLSFLLTLISITLSVVLITISFTFIRFSSALEKFLSENIAINIFIKDGFNQEEINKFKSDLLSQNVFSKIEYIDKDKAVDIFIKETGEDFRKILDYNPLPASFILNIKQDYAREDSIRIITNYLKKLSWVGEVVFKQDFIQRIIKYVDQIKNYIFILTGLIFFVSLYLVYSTVRLILNSKYSELETMKLVGAKLSTIKMPILLNAIFIGIIAGAISITLAYFGYYYLKSFIPRIDEIVSNKYEFILIIILTGPVIGILVSYLSLRKISLKV